jgi:hypothetical protein
MELNHTQKLVIIETIKSWPKEITPRQLLEILDKLAKKINEAK